MQPAAVTDPSQVERRAALRLLVLEHGEDQETGPLVRLCEVAVAATSCQGAGVALIASSQARVLVASSGALAKVVDDLQFEHGEGPCLDAVAEGVVTLEPDLTEHGHERWPLFTAAALAAGVRAVFALPLRIGAARLGAFDLARERAGMLTRPQLRDALILADLATELVLGLHDRRPGRDLPDPVAAIGSSRIVVHQATGMVSAQAGLNVVEALALLRGWARDHDVTLLEASRDVVRGLLRFPS